MKTTFECVLSEQLNMPDMPYENTFSNIVLLESMDSPSLFRIPPEAIKDGLKELTAVATHGLDHQRNLSVALRSVVRMNIVRFGSNEWMCTKLKMPVDDYVVGAPHGISFMTLLCNPHSSQQPCPTVCSITEAFIISCCIQTIVVAVHQQSPGWRLHVQFLYNFSSFIDSIEHASGVLEDSNPVSLFHDEWASYAKTHFSSTWLEQVHGEIRSMFNFNKSLSLQARSVWAAVNTTDMETVFNATIPRI